MGGESRPADRHPCGREGIIEVGMQLFRLGNVFWDEARREVCVTICVPDQGAVPS